MARSYLTIFPSIHFYYPTFSDSSSSPLTSTVGSNNLWNKDYLKNYTFLCNNYLMAFSKCILISSDNFYNKILRMPFWYCTFFDLLLLIHFLVFLHFHLLIHLLLKGILLHLFLIIVIHYFLALLVFHLTFLRH